MFWRKKPRLKASEIIKPGTMFHFNEQLKYNAEIRKLISLGVSKKQLKKVYKTVKEFGATTKKRGLTYSYWENGKKITVNK